MGILQFINHLNYKETFYVKMWFVNLYHHWEEELGSDEWKSSLDFSRNIIQIFRNNDIRHTLKKGCYRLSYIPWVFGEFLFLESRYYFKFETMLPQVRFDWKNPSKVSKCLFLHSVRFCVEYS